MNTTLNVLRLTLRGIFDSYSACGKKLYIRSLVVLLLTSVLGGVISTGSIILAGHIWSSPEITMLGTVDYPWETLFANQQFLGLNQSLIVLFLGLYGVALIRGMESQEEIPPSSGSLVLQITSGEWVMAGFCVFVVVAVHILLFINPFMPDGMGGGLLGMLGSFANEFTWKNLLYETTEAFKNLLLPVFLAVLIVLYSIRGKINFGILRKHSSAWLASLLLLFSINAVFTAANTLFQDTVIRLLIIPVIITMEPINQIWMWVLLLFGFLCTLSISAFFYPALGLGLASPFYCEERIRAEEAEEINAAPITET